MTKIGPITLNLDMKEHVEKSQAVISELKRRVDELSPQISEEEALYILLIDMTFDYLKFKDKVEQKTE
ncbi:hypothetical protein [Franconibacter helveticus]|uniref:hypothetical protein n=1 Tax=Franconibacter helveticus TaxID=357240 RepID=UPI0004974B60|nr:hypothetical protein [Franconibacter helveticus]